MQILPVASGKGGVGKSLVAANLSIALAQTGKTAGGADSILWFIVPDGVLKIGHGQWSLHSRRVV